jgi:beta-lactamase superfamily II metal-dependent hydrolase
MLTVFNVGQGDSILFKPHSDCKYSNQPLLVDFGPDNSNVDQNIQEDNICLMFTHSHRDHIGGLNHNLLRKSNELVLPYYIPEIIKISEFIGRYLRGNLVTLEFNELFHGRQVKIVKEGDQLCNHIIILNPPESPLQFYEINSESPNIEQSLIYLRENGFDFPTDLIINYNSEIIGDNELDLENYAANSRRFVQLFFTTLAEKFRNNQRPAFIDLLSSHFEKLKNQVSIVFKYEFYNEESILMTGDADINVFERLINKDENLIKADILKVPHHGSRGNMTKDILKVIQPKIAIISHDNGIFGRSKDSHPHYDVIEALEGEKIEVYYTNDVRKDGNAIRLRTYGLMHNGTIEII